MNDMLFALYLQRRTAGSFLCMYILSMRSLWDYSGRESGGPLQFCGRINTCIYMYACGRGIYNKGLNKVTKDTASSSFRKFLIQNT